MDRTTCLVAGGGPAGIVLGLLLARAGVEVTVLEKHGDFLRDFRGDTVHPTTLDLLDELGLGEEFAKLPQRRVTTVQVPIGGRMQTLASFTDLPGRHKYIAMVPQWDLLDLLARAADREPEFRLRVNTEATDIIREGGRVAGVRYRTNDGAAGEIRADLTVACDGRTSVLREAAGLGSRRWPTPFDVWWFRIPRHDTDPAGVVPVLTAGRVAIMLDRGDYWQCATLIAKGSDAGLRDGPVGEIMGDMAAAVPWLSDRVAAVRDWSEVKLLDVKLDRLDRWYTDGLLCLGDAAHAMSPVGGVGINLAVQDAVAAARILAPKLVSHEVTVADLARVQRRRIVPTVVTQDMQRLLHARAIGPAVSGAVDISNADRTPLPLRILRRIPIVRSVPPYLVGRGVLPEHAPEFARRP
ncbi:2-polyprenyl-6-methoxyphenol hydroxylase-like FAD-dependent oxidoreductase [Nocardia transvalensis]|uniref:2-polyprenyl-6-methoxyphenol hydroxylase-like FAD-dependent oxidoreductase n=1 Tax=Nocardia transvalensis TaxID=37333 RepID=A0A7W9UJT9_9NOCA|nr:FAD-dependent oxidoreductase [Nocardia transvalensis]MBB5915799.1 2-polyprenyl-6-methoxyphenol hydroxylase-like FAD-dependent oxidoreductase [Nocardia transvalensis]